MWSIYSFGLNIPMDGKDKAGKSGEADKGFDEKEYKYGPANKKKYI